MSGPKPDAIVREPEARDSVEELTKGFAEQAKMNGVIPPMREIEKYAQQVTADTIARHEDQFRNGVPDHAPVARTEGSAAKLDRGSYSDDIGDVVKIDRPYDATRLALKTRVVPASDLIESRLVDERMRMLLSWENSPDGKQRERFPEWAERLRKAYTETLALSKNLGIPHKEAESNAADAVLTVLDASNVTFGDWRFPRGRTASPPMIFISKG